MNTKTARFIAKTFEQTRREYPDSATAWVLVHTADKLRDLGMKIDEDEVRAALQKVNRPQQ